MVENTMSQFEIGVRRCKCGRIIRKDETPPKAFSLGLCNPCHKDSVAESPPVVSESTKSQVSALTTTDYVEKWRKRYHVDSLSA